MIPICLFTYNRLEATMQTVAALKKNFLASESDLFIFSDGAKSIAGKVKVKKVRSFLQKIDGFKSVQIIESHVNKGLGNSIISGVSQIVAQYGKVIVLEDDLVTTPNFLSYMNQALNFYEDNDKIISVCGFGLKIKKPTGYPADVYLYARSSSWGWGTWKNKWETVDWEVNDWEEFRRDKKAIRSFNKGGSDLFKILKSVTEGNASSWAVRFVYAQFKQGQFSIMPFYSLVRNIGFNAEGTNTRFKFSRFRTVMDAGEKTEFVLPEEIEVNKEISDACYRYHSIPIRIYSRLRYILGI